MKQILVVDNDGDTVDVIAELLRESGYDALTATTGEQAIRNLRHSHVDLMVLDLFMPGLNGWQVLDTMGRDPQLARIPKIAITAWPRAIQLPPGVALLRKPFEWDTLARLIRSALRSNLPRIPREPESSRAVLLPAH
jgi:CheY-like chemotaxis protein